MNTPMISQDLSIFLIVKRPYGREFYYPHCNLAEMLCQLLKQKTLSQADLNVLMASNWKIYISDGQVVEGALQWVQV